MNNLMSKGVAEHNFDILWETESDISKQFGNSRLADNCQPIQTDLLNSVATTLYDIVGKNEFEKTLESIIAGQNGELLPPHNSDPWYVLFSLYEHVAAVTDKPIPSAIDYLEFMSQAFPIIENNLPKIDKSQYKFDTKNIEFLSSLQKDLTIFLRESISTNRLENLYNKKLLSAVKTYLSTRETSDLDLLLRFSDTCQQNAILLLDKMSNENNKMLSVVEGFLFPYVPYHVVCVDQFMDEFSENTIVIDPTILQLCLNHPFLKNENVEQIATKVYELFPGYFDEEGVFVGYYSQYTHLLNVLGVFDINLFESQYISNSLGTYQNGKITMNTNTDNE